MSGPAVIDRTNYAALVDDDGTNTTGTNWNKTQITNVLLDPIDALIAKLYANTICDGRLTLTTAVPVTTADVTAATTLRYAPFKGNRIALFDGSVWNVRTFTELSIAVPATTSQMYDVWVYDNSGTATLELLAWTNDTTRATALTTQEGVIVKTGATTRRYVGSFRTTTVSGQTEDSMAKRYVWNYYHRVDRVLRVSESADSWAYTLFTYRPMNNSTANALDVVVGIGEVPLHVTAVGHASNSTGGIQLNVSIGEDSTTTAKTGTIGGWGQPSPANNVQRVSAELRVYPAVGRHVYTALERSVATGTTSWYGDAADSTSLQSGIFGSMAG